MAPRHPLAEHLLAACAGQVAPVRACDKFVRHELDHFAKGFDDQLRMLGYCAPELLVEALQRELKAAHAHLAILNAGCGTGMCGPVLKPHARRLDGVDLSSEMVKLASDRGAYDRLVEVEVTRSSPRFGSRTT